MALPSPAEIDAMMAAENASVTPVSTTKLPSPAEIDSLMKADSSFLSDNPTNEQLDAMLAKGYAAQPRSIFDTIGRATQSFNKGITLGLADPIKEYTAKGLDYLFGDTKATDAYKQDKVAQKQFEKENPVLSTAAQIGGGVTLGPAKAAYESLAARLAGAAGQGAILGGASGFGEGEGLSNRLDKAVEGAKIGAVAGPIVQGAGEALVGGLNVFGNLGKNLPKTAKVLDRGSLGVGTSDLTKKANELDLIDLPDGDLQSFIATKIDDVLSSGKLGASRDPNKLLQAGLAQEENLSKQIGTIINEADKSGVKAVPTFSRTLSMIENGNLPASKADEFLKKVVDTSDAIAEQGKGSLKFLQNQKVAAGRDYQLGDQTGKQFAQALYGDLKDAVEAVVPEIGPLNQELQKYKILNPILDRELKKSEATGVGAAIKKYLPTGGGLTVPIVAGAAAGNPVLGMALAAPGAYAMSRRGAADIASIMRGAAPTLDVLGAPARGAAALGGLLLERPSTYIPQITKTFETPSQDPYIEQAVSNLKNKIPDNELEQYLKIPEGTSMNDSVKMPPTAVLPSETYTDKSEEASSPKFADKVIDIAKDLGARPEHLMAVMRFETQDTLSPKKKNNAGSKATGLIQFMPKTAQGLLKTKTKEAAIKLLENMTAVEQLDYVKKHLLPFKGKLNTLDDLYMAVLLPSAVGKSPNYPLFKEDKTAIRKELTAYWQNRGLDINKDGIITKAEAASKVKKYDITEV